MRSTIICCAFLLGWTACAAAAEHPDHDKIAEDVRKILSDVDRDDLSANLKAVSSLDQYIISRKEAARKMAMANGVTDDAAMWRETVEHLVGRAKKLESRDGEKDALHVRELIVDILASDAKDAVGREYLMHVLDNGPNNLRMKIIWAMRGPNGLHGVDASKKVKDLCDKGVLPEKLRGMALASAGQENLDDALNYLATTHDRMGFINAAMAYQITYRSSDHFDLLLRRVKELKLNEPVEKYRDGVFWINPKLLAQFIDKATGDDLKNALEVMGMNAGLIGVGTADLMPVIKCLSNTDPAVRQLAAKRLAELESVRVDHDLIVSSIATARQKESDSPTKAVLDDALKTVTARRDRLRMDRERWLQGAPK